MATLTHLLPPEAALLRSSGAADIAVANGTNIPVTGLAFDDSTVEAAFWHFVATGYGSGSLTATVLWYASTATSGNVVWGAQLSAITPNSDSQDVETDSLAGSSEVTDSHLGTTAKRVHSIQITVSNVDGLAADDRVAFRLFRNATSGSDTMTGDAIVTEVTLSYSDT